MFQKYPLSLKVLRGPRLRKLRELWSPRCHTEYSAVDILTILSSSAEPNLILTGQTEILRCAL